MYHFLGMRIAYVSGDGPQQDHRDHDTQEHNKEYRVDEIEPV